MGEKSGNTNIFHTLLSYFHTLPNPLGALITKMVLAFEDPRTKFDILKKAFKIM